MEVLDRLDEWKAQERKGPGGRPQTFSTRALLVALVLCALTDQPLHLNRVCDVMFRQLSPQWCTSLGIPDPPADGDIAGWEAAYRNVRTRFPGVLDLMDPSPTPKNRRLDHDSFVSLTEQRGGQRSKDEWVERSERLAWFVNQFLEASLALLPREVRRKWKGSVGVDATLVKSFASQPGGRPHRTQTRQLDRTPRSLRKELARPEVRIHRALARPVGISTWT